MILLIDNYDSFTYNLYQAFSEFEPQVEVVRNDRIDPDHIKSLSPAGIVLSPGPGRPEDAGRCIEIIQCFSGTIPILGVCLGHQAIAIAFGGKVIRSQQIIHGKSSRVLHKENTIYRGLPPRFEAGRYHSLVVEPHSLPCELQIQAQTEDGIIMGLAHVSHPTYGVQFHPESILSPQGNRILNNFLQLCHCEVAT